MNETTIRTLIFIAVNALPLWYIFRHFRDRERFRDILEGLEEQLMLQKGHGIWREGEDRDAGDNSPWVIAGVLGAVSGVATESLFAFFFTAGIGVYWAFINMYWNYAAPIVNKTLAQRRQAVRQAAQAASFSSRASFEAPPDDDDAFFSSKAQQQQRERERPRQERKPPPKQETPYGFDKRHPKDAKLWAVVDDPNASDGERQAAFSAILKRNAQRKRGEDPKPASDADVRLLIGSNRK